MQHQMGLLPLVQLLDPLQGKDGSLLVVAVGGTHRHSQGADAGLVNELCGILHLGVILGNALGGLADFAQLTLDADAHFRGHLHDASGDCNVLLQGLSRSVDHNARRAVAERPQNFGNARAVIQMERHGGLHVVHGLPDDGGDILGDLGIKQAAVHLENHGSAGFLGCLHDAHNGFQVVHIERGDGEAVLLANVQNLLQIVNHNASSCYVVKFQFFRF